MKKYFPIVVFVMVFAGFLACQITFDLMNISAGQSTREKSIKLRYQNVFKNITLKSMNGKKFKPFELESKVVILNFWSTWCAPCLHELPTMVEMKKKFDDNKVMVFAINSDDEREIGKIQKIQKELKINFPVILDSKGKIHREFMVSSIPFSIIFKNGKFLGVEKGFRDFNSEEMLQMIR